MKEKHPSDSSEQQQAHKEILVLLNKTYDLNLASKKLLIGDTLFQSDGYSDEPPIMCEIYSRIGEMKVAQFNKIGKDILKMLLIEEMLRQAQQDNMKKFRKFIVFADEEAAKSFASGESWYSKVKDYFDIEIIVVDIPEELRTSLIAAQKRQYR